jgi:hypothetical protein
MCMENFRAPLNRFNFRILADRRRDFARSIDFSYK